MEKRYLIAILAVGLALLVMSFYTPKDQYARVTKERLQPIATSPQSELTPVETLPSTNEIPPGLRLTKNSDGSLNFPANYSNWYPIGTGTFTLEITGTIDYGGEQATADNSRRMGDGTAKAVGIPFGVMIAKIGQNGQPFQIGSSKRIQGGGDTVYIAINDSKYTDNRGFYSVYKR